MLIQRTLFILRVMAKRYAESGFRDTCRTSSGLNHFVATADFSCVEKATGSVWFVLFMQAQRFVRTIVYAFQYSMPA